MCFLTKFRSSYLQDQQSTKYILSLMEILQCSIFFTFLNEMMVFFQGRYVGWILARQAAAFAPLVATGDEGSGYQETRCPGSFFLI